MSFFEYGQHNIYETYLIIGIDLLLCVTVVIVQYMYTKKKKKLENVKLYKMKKNPSKCIYNATFFFFFDIKYLTSITL